MQNASLAIITNSDNHILLVQRKDIPIWVLPGGGIENCENPDQAVVREAEEETGLPVHILTHIATYTPVNSLSSTTYLFHCTPATSVLPQAQEKEAAAVQYFPLEKLPSHLFFLHKNFVKEWQTASSFPIERSLTEITYFSLLFTFLRHPWWILRYLWTRFSRQ